MVGHFLKTGKVGAIVTGADRIASNGDTANKIGTYQMAVLAKENNVPFYIAAPVSTFDLSIASGEQIPIEERSSAEVTQIQGIRIAPDVHALRTLGCHGVTADLLAPGHLVRHDPDKLARAVLGLAQEVHS